MKRWAIKGGVPLAGRVRVNGAKNVAIKLMIAALLGDEEITLLNVPDVGDVHFTIDMIRHLGCNVSFISPQTITINPSGLTNCELPADLAKESRASSIFIGPLLARCEEIKIPLPGGDQIGKRPLDRHFMALKALGAEVIQERDSVRIASAGLKGTHIRFPKNTHTGTETLILAAVLADGQTILENAAEEPEIDDLIGLLNCMGASVKRSQPRTIIIEGGKKLNSAKFKIMCDRNKAVSYACMALATQGDIRIDGINAHHLNAFLKQLDIMGAGFEVEETSLHVWYKGKLAPLDITTSPYPGIMSDWQPLLTTLLTQVTGTSIIHETIFERRFGYVEDLTKMGARIDLFNPAVADPEKVYNFNWADSNPNLKHAVKVYGPTQLRGLDIQVHDVRAGATLVQAALTAPEISTMTGVHHIERGYECLDSRLRGLGANIEVDETKTPD